MTPKPKEKRLEKKKKIKKFDGLPATPFFNSRGKKRRWERNDLSLRVH